MNRKALLLVVGLVVLLVVRTQEKKEAGPITIDVYGMYYDNLGYTDSFVIGKFNEFETTFNKATKGNVILNLEFHGAATFPEPTTNYCQVDPIPYMNVLVSSGYDNQIYDSAYIMVSTSGCGYNGGIIFSPDSTYAFLHEMGHYIGLGHSCQQCAKWNYPSEGQQCYNICPGYKSVMTWGWGDNNYSICDLEIIQNKYILEHSDGSNAKLEYHDECNFYNEGHICNEITKNYATFPFWRCDEKCENDIFYSGSSFCYNDNGDCKYANVVPLVCNESEQMIKINHAFNGSSTDFNSLDNFSNIQNIIIENTERGMIIFNQPISIMRSVNLDNYIQISKNKIKIDSIQLPEFNKQAVLKLYDLNFTNPRILKDGVVCSDCNIISYSDRELEFTVNSWSEYSAEETPSDNGNGNGGGGGGGGASYKECYYVENGTCEYNRIYEWYDCDEGQFNNLTACGESLEPEIEKEPPESSLAIVVIIVIILLLRNKRFRLRKKK